MSRDIADELRKAITDSGHSANHIAKEAGVDQTLISRFLRGKDMGIARAAKIAAFLGLELRTKRDKK